MAEQLMQMAIANEGYDFSHVLLSDEHIPRSITLLFSDGHIYILDHLVPRNFIVRLLRHPLPQQVEQQNVVGRPEADTLLVSHDS